MNFIIVSIKWIFALCTFVILFVFILYWYMSFSSKNHIYTEIKDVPKKEAAVLLGTSKYISKGHKNYFYIYRIRAAADLWKKGKVKAIVVSGNNESKYYNEPKQMREDLIKAGVPEKYITADNSGFRTLDSIIRAKEVFDLEDYIIVSQKFHLQRALFIAKAKGQKVIGYAAKDIAGTAAAKKMIVREYLARTKAFLDVFILNTKAKEYGKKEKVNYRK